MRSIRSIKLYLKLRQNRIPLLIVLGYLILGFFFFLITEPNKDFINIILLTLQADMPKDPSIFSKLYGVIWSFVIAQAILGFIISSFLQEYNPQIACKMLAKNLINHSIIIHYDNFGKRIIDFLKENNKPFAVIEDNLELVEDLVNETLPVIVGDPIEHINLKSASINNAKEVFIISQKPEECVITTQRVREINPTIPIYARVFDTYIASFLQNEPFNAITFSTTLWALKEIEKYFRKGLGSVIIMGHTRLSTLLCEELTTELNRKVYYVDQSTDPEIFSKHDNITFLKTNGTYFNYLEKNIPMESVTQLFICWKEESYFQFSFDILMYFKNKWPHIKTYVRFYNEEMKEIAHSLGATSFSTSREAFKYLQKEVNKDSNIRV